MLKLILIILLFALSLLTVFRAPASLLWYVSILITEFSWLFFVVVLILLFALHPSAYRIPTSILGVAALVLYAVPIASAYRVSSAVSQAFTEDWQLKKNEQATSPFSLLHLVTGIGAKQVDFKTLTYDTQNNLTLDFYSSGVKGKRPCVIVVHGGSWAGGDSRQLPELNSELAKAGYLVATINYRLAPKATFPAPNEDIRSTLLYLRAHAVELNIDTAKFVLLGRSAGGQIVLSAAYTLNDPAIKGVISFYGPTDMVWGYANPTNPLVLNSRKVMEDYLGGTFEQVPQQYINSSPTNSVTSTSPPTLMIYGENDPLVSHLHGPRLSAPLDKAGVKHYELYLPWATHGFDWTLNGPGGQISTWTVKQFLKRVVPLN